MIDVIKVKDRDEGNLRAHDLFKEIMDGNTLLALSGGTSPDYQRMIVDPADILPGAICVVDERYGEPFHKDSTEFLLREQGVKEYADKFCIESHKILKGKSLEETALVYAKEVAELFARFPKRVGVMGVGSNLHTAGIFPNSMATESRELVIGEEVNDKFRQRVTLTLRALSQFSAFVILMFGEDKKAAIRKILDKNERDMRKYPATFYRMAKIKSFLITDQKAGSV